MIINAIFIIISCRIIYLIILFITGLIIIGYLFVFIGRSNMGYELRGGQMKGQLGRVGRAGRAGLKTSKTKNGESVLRVLRVLRVIAVIPLSPTTENSSHLTLTFYAII